MKGHWIKGFPTQVGTYWVFTSNGCEMKEVFDCGLGPSVYTQRTILATWSEPIEKPKAFKGELE